ncbi:MAG: TonB-dependent receptor, partial [Candidatus Aminicenantes bacterium]|nr:TonB-dependent receptor [Candidatus Aminicenantes bacterium]
KIMRKRMSRALLGLLVLALVIGPAVAQAQQGGDLKGKVIDKGGKFPLPTVRVSVVGTRKSAPTNSEGEFLIPGIPAGVYKVTFELAGYMMETSTNVTITAGQTAELNVAMSTGFAHEVTVTARREVETLQMVPQNIEVLTTLELTEDSRRQPGPGAEQHLRRGHRNRKRQLRLGDVHVHRRL